MGFGGDINKEAQVRGYDLYKPFKNNYELDVIYIALVLITIFLFIKLKDKFSRIKFSKMNFYKYISGGSNIWINAYLYLGTFPTFIYLCFFDGYIYNWWNWIIVIPINLFLSYWFPIYWLILRPLMG